MNKLTSCDYETEQNYLNQQSESKKVKCKALKQYGETLQCT